MCDICLDPKAGLVDIEIDAAISNDLFAQTQTELCVQVVRKLETTLRETLSAIEASKMSKVAMRATSDTKKTSETVQEVNIGDGH